MGEAEIIQLVSTVGAVGVMGLLVWRVLIPFLVALIEEYRATAKQRREDEHSESLNRQATNNTLANAVQMLAEGAEDSRAVQERQNEILETMRDDQAESHRKIDEILGHVAPRPQHTEAGR